VESVSDSDPGESEDSSGDGKLKVEVRRQRGTIPYVR